MIYAGKKSPQRGFTIVELIIVIVVIGILAAITVVSYTAVTENAKNQALSTEVLKISSDLKKYKADNGTYPLSLSDLNVSEKYIYNYSPGNGTDFCLSGAFSKMAYSITSGDSSVKKGSCGTNVDGGYYHTIIAKEGKVYTWGRNNSGQLGDGTTTDRGTPQAIDVPGFVIDVAAGYYFSVALDADGQVYAWGQGSNGQIGQGSTGDILTPTAVDMSGAMAGKKVKAIAAGGYFGLALTTDGKLYSWGRAASGELGYASGGTTIQRRPIAVDMTGALAGKTIVAIEGGYYHAIALASDGTVYTWGYNANGELGNNNTGTNSTVPVAVDTSGALSGKKVMSIDAGYYHNVVMTLGGDVYAWGRNHVYQLGNGTTVSSPVPVRINGGDLANAKVSKIVAGGYSSGAVGVGGSKLYEWGYGTSGQLGRNSSSNGPTPGLVVMTGALSGKTLTDFGLGDMHAIAVDTDSSVYTWGNGTYGQLGDNGTSNQLVPQAITLP